ncbi:hypothetical protein, partial [Bacillus smithii]|uniref:hypothetical protein n=1 Tax=Bacillus smithii TaxID=1479 RepID=UPI0030C909BC
KIYTKLPTTGSSAFLLTFFGLCLGLPASARNIRGNLGNYFHRKQPLNRFVDIFRQFFSYPHGILTSFKHVPRLWKTVFAHLFEIVDK